MPTDLLTNPVKLRFYIERYEKENKLITLRKTFVPDIRTKAVTGKFYAKHDVIDPKDIREEDVNLIRRYTEKIPKDIYTFRPPAVNMEYGWFIVPLIPVTKDPRLCFARKHSEYIANEIKLRKLRKVSEKRFTGMPFKT